MASVQGILPLWSFESKAALNMDSTNCSACQLVLPDSLRNRSLMPIQAQMQAQCVSQAIGTPGCEFPGPEGVLHTIRKLIARLEKHANTTILSDRLSKTKRWSGIFGAMAAFDLQFADMLERDLGFSSALELAGEPLRHGRMAMERVLGVIASFGGRSPLAKSLAKSAMPPALQGDIFTAQTGALHMDLKCSELLRGAARPHRDETFLLKCWMGR
jgi:hypothetical protein